MRHRWKYGLLGALIAGVLSLCVPFGARAAEGDVMIDETTFPDEFFRNYVTENFDKVSDGILTKTEREAVDEITVSGKKVTSLKGVEYFPNLTILACSGNPLTSLDVSNNNKLVELWTECCNITELNLHGCKELTKLWVYTNQLTKLDLRTCVSLKTVSANNNKFEIAYLGDCEKLVDLGVDKNKLTSINLSMCPNLRNLSIQNNQIKTVDLTYNPMIYKAFQLGRITSNEYQTRSYKADDELWYTFSFDNTVMITRDNSEKGLVINEDAFPDEVFRTLYVENYDKDKDGFLSKDELQVVAQIDARGIISGFGTKTVVGNLEGIKYFFNLVTLNCTGIDLKELDVSENLCLRNLYCSSNNLTSLNLANNERLAVVNCSKNSLTELNLDSCKSLSGLNCDSNRLSKLTLPSTDTLQTVYCTDNHLESLDITGNRLLNLALCGTKAEINDNKAIKYYIRTDRYGECRFSIDSNVKLISKPHEHSWDEGVVSKAETCTTAGVKTFTCKECGKTKDETIKATGHKEVKDPAVAATYIKKGKTAGSHCSVCGTVIKKQTVIPMKSGLRKIGGKTYFYKNGKKQTGWQKIGKNKYYFKKTGEMLTGLQKIGTEKYYFNKSGVMQKGWQTIKNKKYFFLLKTGVMRKGWLKIQGKMYYFNKKGVMVTGNKRIGSKMYKFNSKGVCLNP